MLDDSASSCPSTLEGTGFPSAAAFGNFSEALTSLGASVENAMLNTTGDGQPIPPLSDSDIVLNVTEVFFDETIGQTVFDVIMASKVSIASLSFQARQTRRKSERASARARTHTHTHM